MTLDCTSLDRCLACGGAALSSYLDLGTQPLANHFHDGSEKLAEYPLGLNVCRECWHSQLTHAVDPHLMFDEYPYVSGTSATLRAYMKEFAERVGAGKPGKILEIGSNDGTLLKEFEKLGHAAIGIEPAENIVEIARENGICTAQGFWNEKTVDALMSGNRIKFDIIIAMNVLAHVVDPLTFLQLCKRVLAPGGRIYVQTSQAKMIERGEFDTVYHEHHSFFTVSSMLMLARREGLRVDAISHVPIHGTSYLFELVDQEVDDVSQGWNEFAIGRVEHDNGYYAINIYEEFATRAEIVKYDAVRLISTFRALGYRIVGYGAAAKAMTFLNFCGLQLDCIIDDNPLKVGKLTPGMNIPVVDPPTILLSLHKILFVILAWNFAPEIMTRIKTTRGLLVYHDEDKFLTFFPTVSLI